MSVESLHALAAGRIIEMMVLSGTVIAGVVMQRWLLARVLLSQPTPRVGLVGSLGVVEAITAFGLAAFLALLASSLAPARVAPSESLMEAARAYSIVQFVADRGGAFLVATCAILACVAYSDRRSGYLRQLDRARSEYTSSLKQRITYGRTYTLDEDGCTQAMRETIRRLENKIMELLSRNTQATDELTELHDARTKALKELVALELGRRISHVDIYGEAILNGPQDHRRGHLQYLLRSLLGGRHLTRALGIPGRAMFASGLSVIFVSVFLISLGKGRPSTETKTQEAALVRHNLRTSLWAPGLALWSPATADVALAAAHADWVAPHSVDLPPEMPTQATHREPSGALPERTSRPDVPARAHPESLRRAQRALLAKDPFATSRLLLEQGRISEARRVLRRLAESGDSDAALALGSTFDPLAVEQFGPKGRHPDQRRAVYWYRKAHQIDR